MLNNILTQDTVKTLVKFRYTKIYEIKQGLVQVDKICSGN